MTAPKSPHYAFPDFDPIVDRLVASRSAIEADRSLILKTKPDLTPKDVRVTAFTHLYHIVDCALVSIRFLNDHLLPSDNEWWQQPKQQALFGSYDEWYRDALANSFNNAFVKYAFMHQLFGGIENTFRQLLRKIDPLAANNARQQTSRACLAHFPLSQTNARYDSTLRRQSCPFYRTD